MGPVPNLRQMLYHDAWRVPNDFGWPTGHRDPLPSPSGPLQAGNQPADEPKDQEEQGEHGHQFPNEIDLEGCKDPNASHIHLRYLSLFSIPPLGLPD